MNLIEKIRQARQKKITTAGVTLIVTRPTDLDMLQMNQSGGVTKEKLLKDYVVGWVDVTEADLVAGGSDTPVEFDKELFIEWMSDKPDSWEDITNTVVDLYKAHEAKLGDDLKN